MTGIRWRHWSHVHVSRFEFPSELLCSKIGVWEHLKYKWRFYVFMLHCSSKSFVQIALKTATTASETVFSALNLYCWYSGEEMDWINQSDLELHNTFWLARHSSLYIDRQHLECHRKGQEAGARWRISGVYHAPDTPSNVIKSACTCECKANKQSTAQ